MGLVPYKRSEGIKPDQMRRDDFPKSRYLSVNDLPPVLRQVLDARGLKTYRDEVDVNVGRFWCFNNSTIWGSVTEYVFVNLTTGGTTNKVFPPYERLDYREYDPEMDDVWWFALSPDVAVLQIVDVRRAESRDFREDRQDVNIFVHEVNFAKLLPPLQIPTLREFEILEVLAHTMPKFMVLAMKRKNIYMKELREMAKKGYLKLTKRSFPALTIDGRNLDKDNFNLQQTYIYRPMNARICAKYPEQCETEDIAGRTVTSPRYDTKAYEERDSELEDLRKPKGAKGLKAAAYYERAVKIKHRKREPYF